MKNISRLSGLTVSLALSVAGCGGGTATRAPATRAEQSGGERPSSEQPLSERELAKLDDRLRDRVEADFDDGAFPVRVKFTSRPPRDELTTLFLVAYERDAIGRVDLATLKSIAARADVQLISFVDGAGYGDSESRPERQDDDVGSD